MCGIIGYIGRKNAIPIIIDGLKNLEYRGYDSAGIAYELDGKIKIEKEKGKIINLETKINNNDSSSIGIGHTRWATHGTPNYENSHPHRVGNITIVHNGIIENYEELKTKLQKNGYKFNSDTDTEVACAVIDFVYKETKNILKTLEKCQKIFLGSYAFGIIVDDDFENLYTMRKDSPLIIGTSNDGNFIASDVPAILKYTNKYYLLDNGEIAKIKKNDITIYHNSKEIHKDINTFDFDIEAAAKDGYEHFMLKEINEQPKVIKNMIHKFIENNEIDNLPDLSKYNKIDIVACGSAYHSGLVGKYLIEEYGNIPVYCEIASEYRYKKLFFTPNTLVIVISQSGETADTLASLRLAKEAGCDTLGIINSVGSSIAREVDNVLYINAGCEIAVATTKAYTLQVLFLSFLAYKLGLDKKLLNKEEINKYYIELPSLIEKQLKNNYNDIANLLKNKHDIYFIGRNIDYANALEGSLKLKEISYIHSETYPAGELKHGSISLIEQDTPVISIITEEKIKDKTISNVKEVKARGSYNIIIAKKQFNIKGNFYDKLITIKATHKLVSPIETIIPLQIIAYNVAKEKGCEIDKPRNLAKSVTVE